MIDFLLRNPADAQTFVDIRFFTSKDRALKRLAKLFDRKEIKYRRHLQMADGQFRLVYAAERVTNLAHEYMLTQFVVRAIADDMRRGPDVDQRYKADAELDIDGGIFYVEMDRKTENRKQVRKQMERYAFAGADVLWIVPDERRMKSLMTLTDSPTVWFTTYDKSLTPHAEVWVNVHGETTALPIAGRVAE